MGRGQRIGFAALAAVIAIVAVIVLAGGPDEATEQADTPPPTATQTSTPEPTEEPELEARSTPTPTPAPEVETIRVRDGEVAGGPARLEFEKGDTARFAVTSDTADEVHVHGYDISRAVAAGGTARLRFRADIEGIFEVELHGSGAQVAQLRVNP